MEYNVLKLNTARNALRYIIRSFYIDKIYVPYYLCPSVRIALQKEKCKIIFYHVDLNFHPVKKFPKEAYILYPNYFGVCSDIVKELSEQYRNLIVDNAHAFYSKAFGIASFNSVRKFFPCVKDGALLYSKKTFDICLQQDDFIYKKELMSEKDFILNENRLDIHEIKLMSDCSFNILNSLDLKEEKEKKIARYNYYSEKYSSANCLNIYLEKDDVPFKYPFLAASKKEADELANELNKQNHIVYRYWNNLPDSFIEKEFYNRLIAI